MPLTADQDSFLKLEYKTLRKEIEDSKSRMFKIIAGEVFLIPILQFLLEWKELRSASFVYLFMPLLVWILVSRFLYENNCIFRAGCYIRSYIEPFYTESEIDHKFKGWEEWLELERDLEAKFNDKSRNKPDKTRPHRKPDRLVKEGFYLLSAFFYIITLYLAWNNVISKWHLILQSIVLIIYILLAVYITKRIFMAWISTSDRFTINERSEDNLRIIERAIVICPNNIQLWKLKGKILYEMRENEEAIAAFEAIVEIDPTHAEAWYDKGLSLDAIGRSREAQEAYAKARELGFTG